jgi:hypothetical protein
MANLKWRSLMQREKGRTQTVKISLAGSDISGVEMVGPNQAT